VSAALDDRVRGVLLRAWDPDGVGPGPLGAARYDCQVQDLTLLLLGEAAPEELANYLRTAETTRFARPAADEARLATVVRELAALRVAPDAHDAAGRG
jgi:hypothetical protein